jgi:hypothetical protein
MRLEAAPNWREINRNPRWLQWLQEIDSLSGRTKQQGTRRAESRSSVASSKRWAKLLDGPDRRGPKSPFIRALRLLSSTVRTAKVRTLGAKPSGLGRTPTSLRPVEKGASEARNQCSSSARAHCTPRDSM